MNTDLLLTILRIIDECTNAMANEYGHDMADPIERIEWKFMHDDDAIDAYMRFRAALGALAQEEQEAQ